MNAVGEADDAGHALDRQLAERRAGSDASISARWSSARSSLGGGRHGAHEQVLEVVGALDHGWRST